MFRLCLALALVFSARAFPENIRIVNGTNAKPGEIPYIVSLKNGDFPFCGGTIINQYWILTAAHCVNEKKPDKLNIQYGVTHITTDGVNTLLVEKIIYHPDFAPENFFLNDVAVVKLKQPIKFSKFAQPVTLPPAFNSTPGGAVAVAAGWGRVENGKGSVDLQRVDLDVYTDEDCEGVYGDDTNRRYHICAGMLEDGKGTCIGDSGGPLAVNGTQVGITSWLKGQCGGKYPGVFAKVSSYVEWIHENIDD